MKHSEPFRFKQFSVDHSLPAMKVGTDGVLLGAWAELNNARNVLDVGSGTGLVSLMLAQRFPAAMFDAIDVEKNAFRSSSSNFGNSPWAARLNALHGDFLSFPFTRKYDQVVSNPPYYDNHHSCPDIQRTTARHASWLPLGPFFEKCRDTLFHTGKISLILPYPEQNKASEAAAQSGYFLTRSTAVRGRENKPFKRVLLEFSSLPTERPALNELTLEKSDGSRTDEHTRLTRDFYLNL